jgi:hypothetical protein
MQKLLALFFCGSAAFSPLFAQEPEPADLVFFRAPFDDSPAALRHGKTVAPVRSDKLSYESEGETKALRLPSGGVLEYDLGQSFPGEAGAIEVRFKPDFPQKPDQSERTAFTLESEAGERLSFGFSPNGTRWQFATEFGKWRRKIAASYFNETHERRWNHLVLTWDLKASSGPLLRFYRDGKWDRGRTEEYARSFGGLRRLVIGATAEVLPAIDEIVIYRGVLDEADVAFLYGAFDRSDRFTAWRDRRSELAKVARAAVDARRVLIAQLRGRVAQIINPRGGQQRDFTLPGGIVATGLRVEDVGRVDLSRFAVIYGPPGGGYQLTREQDEILRQYVQAGGGYVGVCAGANYAGRAKLLPMTTHSLKNQGLVTVGVRTHPITEGFHGEVVIHHGNGPIMVPGEGCQVVGTFQVGQNFPITTAAIVAGANGQGRVAAFGPHPTGGGVEFEKKGAHFSGSDLGTDALLVNALLWAAKIVGPE